MRDNFQVALYVQDGFSLFGFAVASEVFRFANEQLGRQTYLTAAISIDAGLIRSSNGLEVNATTGVGQLGAVDAIILCSQSPNTDNDPHPVLVKWLRERNRRGNPIFALGSGVWLLAQSGLLNGSTCTAHWMEIPALRLAFPDIRFTRQTFTSSENIWVCTGGDSVTDMLLHFLSLNHGLDFSADIRRKLILKPSQALNEQRNLMFHSYASNAELVVERFLTTIEEAIENPLPISEICQRLQVSQRALNRYTYALLGLSPKEIYLNMRTAQAARLLLSTRLKMAEIAAACGFDSASHFSQTFASKFGDSPSKFRAKNEGGYKH